MPYQALTCLPRVTGGTTGVRYGIPGQSCEVFGLWVRVCFHCGRTDLLRRKRFQERAQALQTLQGKAEPDGGWPGSAADGNHDDVLAVWQGDHGSFPADAGSTSVLPGVFSGTACNGGCCVNLRDRKPSLMGAGPGVSPWAEHVYACVTLPSGMRTQGCLTEVSASLFIPL